jgi:hypothetical protein
MKFHTVLALVPFVALFSLSACADEDTGEATPAAQEYLIQTTVTDGFSGAGVADVEMCVESPVGAAGICETTDADGVIERTWSAFSPGRVLTRLTHDDYMTTVLVGRMDSEVLANWDGQMEEDGAVKLGSIIVSELLLTAAISGLGISVESGMGHVFYVLISSDESSVAGATLTVLDATGAEAGVPGYADETGLVVDTALTETSVAGGFGAVNLPPGEYTVEVTLPGSTCSAGVAWPAVSGQTFPFPVEADSVTTATVVCTVE